MKGSSSLVSVIMPSHNHAEYIGESIHSVLHQTYKNIELIVINDNSTDNTEDAVRSFDNKTVKLYSFNSTGIVASARNYGLQKAEGDIIAFIDSDDIWLPNKLEVQLSHLSVQGTCCVASNFIPIGDVKFCRNHLSFSSNEIYRDYTYDDIVLANPIMTSSLLTRKAYLDELGGFDENRCFRFIEDWELWLRISRIGNVRVLSEPLIKYRVVRQKNRDVRDISLNTLKIFEKHSSLGYLNEDTLTSALGNCFVNIGKVHLDAGDPNGIRFYRDGLRYSKGCHNKVRSLCGYMLFCLPSPVRDFLIRQYYR